VRVGLLYGLGPRCSYRDALAEIVEADRLGLDSVLFEEHHGAWGAPAVMPLVTAAAARTECIRVGTANRQLTLEFPINGAEDGAVADNASRGRLIFGVSAGERANEFRAAGVPWAERESRFREAVDLVRTVWTQSNVQFVGEHYRFPLRAQGGSGWRREPLNSPFVDQWRRGQVIAAHLPLLPKPVQLPHPPIWVNATSRAIIEWAASRGYSLLVGSLDTEEEVQRKVGWYDAALAAAGRDRNEVEVVLARELFIAEDGERARALALPTLRAYIEAVRAEKREDLAGTAAAGGLDDEALLSRCALYGTPQEILGRLLRLKAEQGINHLVCRSYLPGRRHLDVLASIRLTASALQTRLVA
jgi:alkanesulfonate monooxygenase SsuD/methylene tetrahydromethanopterin reductase-like flavin-dependent oxidoreductase (luciferase family)